MTNQKGKVNQGGATTDITKIMVVENRDFYQKNRNSLIRP